MSVVAYWDNRPGERKLPMTKHHRFKGELAIMYRTFWQANSGSSQPITVIAERRENTKRCNNLMTARSSKWSPASHCHISSPYSDVQIESRAQADHTAPYHVKHDLRAEWSIKCVASKRKMRRESPFESAFNRHLPVQNARSCSQSSSRWTKKWDLRALVTMLNGTVSLAEQSLQSLFNAQNGLWKAGWKD